MEPSSNKDNISCVSDFECSVQAQPAETITYMEDALYKAAQRGDIKTFDEYRASKIESLQTPDKNTVLHVYLATKRCPGLHFHSWWELVIWLTLPPYLIPLRLLNEENIVYFEHLIGRYEENSILQLMKENIRVRIAKICSFAEKILNRCPSLILQPNVKGETPLHVAARYGYSVMVEFLINYYQAQLGKARHNNDGDLEKQAVVKDVRDMLRKTDLESNTPLHIAARYGHLRVVKVLLKLEDPKFSYPANKSQETPLYIAARKGFHRLVVEILRKFESEAVHYSGGPHGRTVLHAAAMAGSAKVTRVILKKKINLGEETDENGQTPLHYAAHLGFHSVVEELLKMDKSLAYIVDKKWEMTALLMAARQGHQATVREIIAYCPSCCDIVDKRGWSLLHFVAIRHSPSELFDSLIKGNVTNIEYILTTTEIRFLKDEKNAQRLGLTPRQLYVEYKRIQFQTHPDNTVKETMKVLEDVFNDQVAEEPVCPLENLSDKMDRGRGSDSSSNDNSRSNTQLVVAALIATVTFAAAVTVPGGYKSSDNGSRDKGGGGGGAAAAGTPFLIHEKAFQAFILTNSLAFLFSVIGVSIHCRTSIYPGPNTYGGVMGFKLRLPNNRVTLHWAGSYIWLATIFIVIAFVTGSYAVLQPCAHRLASATIFIALVFLLATSFGIVSKRTDFMSN